MTAPAVRHRLARAADRSSQRARNASACWHGDECPGTGPDCASLLDPARPVVFGYCEPGGRHPVSLRHGGCACGIYGTARRQVGDL